jgi:hypothetical protein
MDSITTVIPLGKGLTYNCTATRRLIPSCGVYDGLRQPLSLYYRSWLPNPSKGRLTPSKTPMRRLFWPGAVFASIYRLYTDASSKIYLCRVLGRFWWQNTCTNVYCFSLARGHCSDRSRAGLGSQRVEGTVSGERTSRIDPQPPGKSETIVGQES